MTIFRRLKGGFATLCIIIEVEVFKITTPALYVKSFQLFFIAYRVFRIFCYLAYFVMFLSLVTWFLGYLISGVMGIIVESWKRWVLSSKPI